MRATAVRRIASVIRQGGVAIVPTDTAYALAADARNAEAIAVIKRLKERAARKPIALIAADIAQVRRFFVLRGANARLARRYWPGPLTLLLRPLLRRLAVRALSPTSLIGVRVPARAATRRLCAIVGAPLTATSANRSGAGECYTARAARQSLRRSFHTLDAGRLRRRKPSTVVRVNGTHLTILRAGSVAPSLSR